MRKYILVITLLMVTVAYSQEKKEAAPKKTKSLGEKMGDMAGNLLTARTDQLDNCALTATVVSGVYDLRTRTSETKYYPLGTAEGDYAVSITFFKNGGAGLLKLKGEVFCDGQPMEYLGMGSYMMMFREPFTEPKKIRITTEAGDSALILLQPVPEIEILSINNDRILPILDLSEDLTVEFTNPPGSENTRVNAGLLMDLMGARAVNNFADFPATSNKVTIPKEAFSNTEINGRLNAGQFNKGDNFFVLERILKTENSQLGPEQKKGDMPSVTLVAKAYSSWPVIVKGRQEDGILAFLNFSGKFSNDKIGFEIYKPNARTGIPFSRGSKFGLASLTLNGRLYHKETHTSKSEWTVGNTRYTQTTTTTTILEFPQLDDQYWDNMLEALYAEVTNLFRDKFGIVFTDVENVIAAPQYSTLFTDEEVNTYTKISRTYKGTKRSSPKNLLEILGNLSSSKSTETPMNLLMQGADIDGLLSMDINLDIAADKNNHVVLIPSINFSIIGRDESTDNRNGTYAQGTITFRNGVPFNEEAVRSDPNSLVKVCNVDQMIACMDYMITNLRAKEVEMGYDRIWSIGE